MCCSFYAGYTKEFNWIIEEVVISFDSQGKCDPRGFWKRADFLKTKSTGKAD